MQTHTHKHAHTHTHTHTQTPLHAHRTPTCAQVLSTRSRKDVALADIKVNVCVFMFDCLYLNGKSLLQAPLTERREALYRTIKVDKI